MKRPGLGLAALAIAAAIVFAPRPWLLDAPSSSQDPHGALFGRILSPTSNIGEVRDPDYDRSIKHTRSLLWPLAAVALLFPLGRRAQRQADAPSDVFFAHTLDVRPSRAPPAPILS